MGDGGLQTLGGIYYVNSVSPEYFENHQVHKFPYQLTDMKILSGMSAMWRL
jgi:protein associated with RNAse G/E